MAFILAVVAGLCAKPTVAQDVNCVESTTQYEMTACAVMDYQAADGDLNQSYGMAMDMARRLDTDLPVGQVKAATILRDAQRAWIPFRDKACDAESLLARGGTMQPQLFHLCLARLTRQRSEDLRYFGEGN